MFLALISKIKFLGLILNKIKFSCFTVKCIVVKSMKQYQGMTKESEFFWKVQVKFWKICSTLKRSAMWPLSVRIMRGSEHTRWFWRLWVSRQEHVPDWWPECILWIDPYMRGVLEYNGESMVKEKDCEDFMKIKIFKFKSTDSYKGTIL